MKKTTRLRLITYAMIKTYFTTDTIQISLIVISIIFFTFTYIFIISYCHYDKCTVPDASIHRVKPPASVVIFESPPRSSSLCTVVHNTVITTTQTFDQDTKLRTMDSLQKGWFTESVTWPGAGLSLEVEKVLHKEKSLYQDITVLKTKSFGKALILDNIIQCTEFDEFSYQEMITFLPLCSHPNPERVLVVGGGDGGVAREAVKHPKVLSVDVVEIDERVVKISEQYLPFMACGFKHDKVKLHIEDGFEFMKNNDQRFDVIITDSSDPVGPNESLFQKTYIESLKISLKPGGMICSQVGSIWIKEDQDTMIRLSKDCSVNFKKVTLANISIPSYPTGNISFILATDNELVNFKVPAYSFTPEELNEHQLKHYSPDVHSAAFSIPRFARMIIPHINC